MIQKKLKDDTLTYFGIDNIFNHRVDYRALQGRLYRFSLNFKFSSNGKLHKYTENELGENIDLGPVQLNDFLTRPFEKINNKPADFFATYRTRWNIHNGVNRPLVHANKNGSIVNTTKSMIDPSEHGFQQNLNSVLKVN